MRTILTLFIMLPLAALSQDRIITINTDTLDVKVIKSSPNEVEYVYPNEDAINVLSKSLVFKIEYASGRVEVPRSTGLAVEHPGAERAAKPKITPRLRWGFRGGINQPLISGLDNGSTNRLGAMAGVSTELKFLNTPHSIILDAYVNQMYAKSPSGNDGIEVAYVSIPLAYGMALNKWFAFLVGIEPSFTVYSDYYQSGSYYDVSAITRSTVFGLTAGGRFMVVPKRLYLDVRGIGGITDMFTFGGNTPSKINLSLGYYIKY